MKKILIIYTDRFSKRNLETAGIVEQIKEKYDVSLLEYEVYSRRPFWHKIITNFFSKILQYRFSEIHQFKKHLLKKKYKNIFQLNNYDKVNPFLGFPFSRSTLIYNILFWLHRNLYSNYFSPKEYDLVFITSCQEGFSQYVLKWANRKSIPVLCMINSWDHLTFRGPVYDFLNTRKYLVWGEIQKQELICYHHIEASRIVKVGSPQFDFFYKIKNENTSREMVRLEEEQFVVFLPAYNERHGFNEPEACERILQYLEKKGKKFKLVIRPYPKDLTFMERFIDIIKNPNVIINEIESDIEVDRRTFSLLMKHCDLIISGPGTAAMEAMFFNKPIVFLAMENRKDFLNIEIARERFLTDHYENLVDPKSPFFCESYAALLDSVEMVLEKKILFSNMQDEILKQQIEVLDGSSAKLTIEQIDLILTEK